MKKILHNAVAIALLLCAVPSFADDASLTSQVRRDTEWLAGYSSRLVGTKSHDDAVAVLLEKIKTVDGVTVWKHEFPVVMPRVLEASLTVTEGTHTGAHRIHPLWPAQARLQTTPAEGIEGKLIYVRDGEPAQIFPRTMRGQIAVMEMSGSDNWVSVANTGARAIILLGSPKEISRHGQSHVTPLPLNIPRFYVPDGELADALRRGEITSGKLFARCEWHTATATNLYALVPPRPGAKGQPLAIAAQFDAMSIVPELAPGADAAVDTAFALNAMRHFAANRPARPLLFCFLDAYAMNQHGSRQMLYALGATSAEKKFYLRDDEERLNDYRAHEKLAAEVVQSPDALRAISQKNFKELHADVKDEVDREVATIEAALAPLRLNSYAATAGEKESIHQRIVALTTRRTEFFAARERLLSKPDDRTASEDLARLLWQRTRERISNQLKELEAKFAVEKETDVLRDAIRTALGTPNAERVIPFMLGIDLSDAGIAVGPTVHCRLLHVNGAGQASDFSVWLSEIERKELDSVWREPSARRVVNLTALRGGEAMDSHTAGEISLLTSPAQSFGVPGVTWMTLDAPRNRVDTPRDRADLLDWKRLDPQVDATMALLQRLAQENSFTQKSPITANWRRVRGFIVDQSSSDPIPRVPMSGFVTTLMDGDCGGGRGNIWYFPQIPGVRRLEFRFTGTDGQFEFSARPAHAWPGTLIHHVQSYLFAPDGSILRAVDLSKASQSVPADIDSRDKNARPLRVSVFTCQQLDCMGLYDPRFLYPLPLGRITDTRRGKDPSHINYIFWNGFMSAMLDPGTYWGVVMRAGATRNRMLLMNIPEDAAQRGLSESEAMRGFPVNEPLPQHPMFIAAQDMYRLDHWRLENYRRAGITSEPIDRIQKNTAEELTTAQKALEQDDGGTFFRAATAAQASEVRAYQAVRDTANDVVRAALFLLLGLVPFAFAMERLLFATPHVYRQIGYMMAIFLVMAVVLWSFHPAFRISNQPLIIIMAFAIILMSLMVMSVVYGKFEAGLKEIRSGMAETSGARTARFGLLSTAVKLGIANMRKRKLRTALTGTTVVLVTFALLCFVSTSSYVGQREFSLKNKAPYTGVLLRPPSSRPMPYQALTYLRNMLGEQRELAVRYWWNNPQSPQWKIHARHSESGKQISLSAALGLTKEESAVSGIGSLCGNWEKFSSQGGCYLSQEMATQLGAQVGDTIVVAGESLELLDTFDVSRMNRELRDLDGSSLLPVDYAAFGAEQRRDLADAELEKVSSEMESGGGFQGEEGFLPLSADKVIIVPAKLLHGMRDCSMRSIAARTTSDEEARQLASTLTERLAFPIFFGADGDAKVMATTPLTPRAPKSLFFPLLIAGLIIFNTMLSSIAERRKEIYVYTSLGLAPVHVGFLFLAEAVTYGLIGSIFGYVVGQGVATALSKLGWMGGITLNYSGTHAIWIMVMVLIVVVVSSLIPAYLAGKLAAPSNKRSWQVPEPVNDVIRDTLPFTVTGKTANGVIAYLHDYFAAHAEGSIGLFSAAKLRTFRAEVDGRTILGIEGTVWLEPYDLGVRQDFKLSILPSVGDVFEIEIELRRGSGQTQTWRKLNRAFLSDLRSQLLGWRKLRPHRVVQYIQEGAALFKKAQTA